MSQPRVFLLMTPHRQHNVQQAQQFGELVGPVIKSEPFLLIPSGVEGMLNELREGLSDYKSRDMLLLLGNPVVIASAGLVAADTSEDGTVRYLKWDSQLGAYSQIVVPYGLLEE